MRAEATELIEDAGRVIGVRAVTPAGPLEVRADLVVAADGRSSVLRERAGLSVEDLGAPMDVFWFRLSRQPSDPAATMGRFDIGRIFVLINRGEHWQCGYVIPKGSAEDVRRRGLEAFRAEVARLAPWAADRAGEIRDWDDVKLLTVKVDRLRQWHRAGLLCIGDAAHAMSPVGGVGINLAIQDAVADRQPALGAAARGPADPRPAPPRAGAPAVADPRHAAAAGSGAAASHHPGAAGRPDPVSSPPLAIRLLARYPAAPAPARPRGRRRRPRRAHPLPGRLAGSALAGGGVLEVLDHARAVVLDDQDLAVELQVERAALHLLEQVDGRRARPCRR